MADLIGFHGLPLLGYKSAVFSILLCDEGLLWSSLWKIFAGKARLTHPLVWIGLIAPSNDALETFRYLQRVAFPVSYHDRDGKGLSRVFGAKP